MSDLYYQQNVDTILAELNTGKHGLMSEEAHRRLQEYGPNELSKEKGISPLALLFGQLKNPLIFVLIAAAIITFLIGYIIDTIVILAVVRPSVFSRSTKLPGRCRH